MAAPPPVADPANLTEPTWDPPEGPRAPGNLEARQVLEQVDAALFGTPRDAAGRYEIRGKLGAGGMGVVYRAHDPLLDCEVALKQCHPHLVDERGLLGRLRREARAMARLRSERHVVTLYDFFSQGDVVFVVMELVEGTTLRAWQRPGRGWRETLEVYLQAGQGLAAAHRAGLTHRDFKPENVLIDGHGVAKVSDFGLAAIDRSRDGDAGASRVGAVVGTPRYMSPEQVRGEAVDPRSDQFAFCVALWEALLGEHPFWPIPGGPADVTEPDVGASQGMTAAPLPIAFSHAILVGTLRPPPAGSKVPRKIVRALTRGLQRAREDRFATMEGLLAALRVVPTRVRALWAGAAGAALAVGLGALLPAAEPPPPPTRAELALHARDEILGAFGLPDLAVQLGAVAGGELLVAALERYGERWAAGHAEQALVLQARPGDPSASTRLRCLAAARDAAATLGRGLRGATADASWHAAELLAELPAPEECGQMPREWLACGLELSALAEAPATAPVFTALAEATRRELAGDWPAAAGHAEAAVRSAAASGPPLLYGHASHELGRLRYLSGDADAALAALTTARAAVEPSGCTSLRASIYSRLIKTTAQHPSLPVGPAEEWSRLQEILARASPDGGARLADAHNERGLLLLLRGADPRAAIVELELAIALRTRVLGDRPSPDLADSHLNLGIARHQLGDLDGAEQAFAAATRQRAAVVGPAHPLHYKELLARAELATDRGDAAAARELLVAALQRVDGLGRAGGPRARVLLALARADQAAGDLARTREHAAAAAETAAKAAIDPSEAIEIRASAAALAGGEPAAAALAALAVEAHADPRVTPEAHAALAGAQAELAYVAERFADAVGHAGEGLKLLGRAGVREGHPLHRRLLRLRGLAAFATVDTDLAITDLESALASPDGPADERDVDRIVLASALLTRAGKGDHARACELLAGIPDASASADGAFALLPALRRYCTSR